MDLPITVAYAEDHIRTRQLFVRFLEEEDFVFTCQAGNGKELLQHLESSEALPDVCLLDLNMPTMDGFETASYLRNHYPSIRILAYSTNDYTERVERILNSGAHGFVPKDLGISEIKAGLLAVHNGQPFLRQHETSIECSRNRKAQYPISAVVEVN